MVYMCINILYIAVITNHSRGLHLVIHEINNILIWTRKFKIMNFTKLSRVDMDDIRE